VVSGTLALILTFSPGEKGQRLHASLYVVVHRANPVPGAWWFRGSMRKFVGGNGFSVFEHLPGLVHEADPDSIYSNALPNIILSALENF
jgi:hypothetical protein